MTMADFGFDVSWEETSFPDEDDTEPTDTDTHETVTCPHCQKEFAI
jgi:hypothetical protein